MATRNTYHLFVLDEGNPCSHFEKMPRRTPDSFEEESMSRHYPIVVEQDADGVFIVECPVFEGCRSYGSTLDEAMTNIREAIELCMDESDDSDTGTIFLGIRDIELTT